MAKPVVISEDLKPWEGQLNELRGLVSERAFTGETLLLNMGPQHPSTHGVLRLLLELDGEEIVTCLPDIGYLHTGIEKTMESKSYEQIVTLTDRMDYLSPMSNNMVYSLAVEKLVDLDVPPRAQAIRVIGLELSRIMSHLVWLATHPLDIGALTPYFYCLRERERILDMYEMLGGQRMMSAYIRPGGVWRDLPPEFLPAVESFLADFPSRIADYERLLTKNPIWLDRTLGVGIIAPETALAWGASGPCLRGSGVNWDIRKAMPYSGYEQYEFDVPLGEHGDVYDRYLIRVEEMRQSARIIRQAIDKLPDGPFRSENRKFIPPPRAELGQSMEALIHHFKLWTEGFPAPDAEVYVAIESPRGEIGCYLHGTGGNQPRRIRFKTPSFMHIQILSTLAKGHMVADLVAIIGSLDFIMGDCDR